jgi:glycosyltransferase involved in cell wall biosynthesis
MIVDNGIDGDSRVQKTAQSAAEAGWEVILLGRGSPSNTRTWKIGQADVRLLPVEKMLAIRRHEFRRQWLVAPLAYRPGGTAARRQLENQAWRADLAVRAAERKITPDPSTPSGVLLNAETYAAKITGKWIGLRIRQVKFGRRVRRRLSLPSDQLYTLFWRMVSGKRAWRHLEPQLWDFELAYGKVIDQLDPDLIHAHDFRMLGVGARAAARAKAEGRNVKLVWDAHEFLAGVQPWQDNKRWLPGNVAHEREYANRADAVITVSNNLAELLQRTYNLPQLPDVVLNAPDLRHDSLGEPAPGIRAACGLGPTDPLLVYSGAAAEKRGISVMIEGLPQLPNTHVALVVGKLDAPFVTGLRQRAEQLGAADRLHILPYVPHWQVVGFLASADIGVIPIRHFPNHEIALITKFFEYSHARLPIVVSDVRTMAETVASTGQGEIFRADDVNDYVRAVRTVLAELPRYRAAYNSAGLLEQWTWVAQAGTLDRVYRTLMPESESRPASVSAPEPQSAELIGK